uniref:Leucine-rich repeat-containing N-terminal plant-type domain-containing protein n=1 Tax=Oryza rufipogon TaxID=4529 RepID=A0A0E0QYF0_ORYRU
MTSVGVRLLPACENLFSQADLKKSACENTFIFAGGPLKSSVCENIFLQSELLRGSKPAAGECSWRCTLLLFNHCTAGDKPLPQQQWRPTKFGDQPPQPSLGWSPNLNLPYPLPPTQPTVVSLPAPRSGGPALPLLPHHHHVRSKVAFRFPNDQGFEGGTNGGVFVEQAHHPSASAVLGALERHTTLLLYSNRLVGSLPPSLGGLAALRMLHISDTSVMSSPSLVVLSRLANLTVFELASCNLNNTILRSLGRLTKERGGRGDWKDDRRHRRDQWLRQQWDQEDKKPSKKENLSEIIQVNKA